jgi:hypothetical protein
MGWVVGYTLGLLLIVSGEQDGISITGSWKEWMGNGFTMFDLPFLFLLFALVLYSITTH